MPSWFSMHLYNTFHQHFSTAPVTVKTIHQHVLNWFQGRRPLMVFGACRWLPSHTAYPPSTLPLLLASVTGTICSGKMQQSQEGALMGLGGGCRQFLLHDRQLLTCSMTAAKRADMCFERCKMLKAVDRGTSCHIPAAASRCRLLAPC